MTRIYLATINPDLNPDLLWSACGEWMSSMVVMDVALASKKIKLPRFNCGIVLKIGL